MSDNPYKAPESNLSSQAIEVRGTFDSLFDLGYQRSVRQAIAFYFTYFIAFLCLGFLVGFISASVFGVDQLTELIVGAVSAVIGCTGLAIAICIKKSIFMSAKSIAFVFLTLVASILLGALLGLVPVSYLTTLDKKT